MKYLKIQQDVLKASFGKQKFLGCEDDENVYVGTKAAFYIVPKSQWKLDLKKTTDFFDMKGLLQFESSDEAIDTHLEIDHPNEKGKLHIYHSNRCDEDVYVDPRLLSYFDNPSKICYSGQLQGLWYYEDGELVGMVLPVRKNF